MFETLLRPQQPRQSGSKERERLKAFLDLVKRAGYRCATRDDLAPYAQMFVVDVHAHMQRTDPVSGPGPGWAEVQIDANPIADSHVRYRCIDSTEIMDTRPVDIVLRSGPCENPDGNRYRWIVPFRS